MSTALKKKHEISKICHHKCKILNRNWRMLPTSKSYAKFLFIALFEICTGPLPLPLGEVPRRGGEGKYAIDLSSRPKAW